MILYVNEDFYFHMTMGWFLFYKIATLLLVTQGSGRETCSFRIGWMCQSWAFAAIPCSPWKTWYSSTLDLHVTITFNLCIRAYTFDFMFLTRVIFFSGDFVAHIKFTVLLMPNGSDRITSHSLQEFQPTKTVDDPEIKTWLSLPVKSKKKGGGKKKKGTLALFVIFYLIPTYFHLYCFLYVTLLNSLTFLL